MLLANASCGGGGWQKEIEKVKLPAFPRNEDLVAFEVSAASRDRFFIDEKALSIGADGIVRYTLVIKTGGGAINVSYEGMRCDLRETKMYATGRGNGTWLNVRDPQWRPIKPPSILDPRDVLHRNYLCGGLSSNVPAASVEDVLQHIRYGPRQPMIY